MYLLEPLFRHWRIKKILPHLKKGWTLVDVGCGYPPKLLEAAREIIAYGVGIDEVGHYAKKANLETFRHSISKELKLESNSADGITMAAVMEHLEFPKEILAECYRVLKPSGTLLITVPSPKAKIILEIFAKLRLVDPEMIHQHQNYFTGAHLSQLLKQAGFENVSISTFELGFNTFIKAIK